MATQIRCVVVTPERALLDEQVDFVVVPMYDGELGVLPGRAPLIGKLGFGELRTEKGGQVKRYYVDGGFVQVRNNVVTLLTSKAQAAAELKEQAAQDALRGAQKVATTLEEQDALLKAQQKARAQLRLIAKTRPDL